MQVTPIATRPGCDHRPRQTLVVRPGGCLPTTTFGYSVGSDRSQAMVEADVELIWDLLIFLVLVAVGLVVLNLLARTR